MSSLKLLGRTRFRVYIIGIIVDLIKYVVEITIYFGPQLKIAKDPTGRRAEERLIFYSVDCQLFKKTKLLPCQSGFFCVSPEYISYSASKLFVFVKLLYSTDQNRNVNFNKTKHFLRTTCCWIFNMFFDTCIYRILPPKAS